MAALAHTNGSKLLPFTLALLAAVAIGVLDVLTGQDVMVSELYVLDVVFVAWKVGRTAGGAAAMLCAALGVVADHLLSEPYLRFGTSFSSQAIPIWNGVSSLMVYGLTAYVVAALREAVRQRDGLIAELERAAADIRTLEGLLPMCAWCKKMRDDERGGAWVPMEAYIATHTDAQVTHGICPACSAQHFGSKP